MNKCPSDVKLVWFSPLLAALTCGWDRKEASPSETWVMSGFFLAAEVVEQCRGNSHDHTTFRSFVSSDGSQMAELKSAAAQPSPQEVAPTESNSEVPFLRVSVSEGLLLLPFGLHSCF